MAAVFSMEAAVRKLPSPLPNSLFAAAPPSPGATPALTLAALSRPPPRVVKPILLANRPRPASARNAVPESVSPVADPVEDVGSAPPPVRIVAVVGDGTVSPLKGAPWEVVMLHTDETG
uniref:Uncharacterized protein n=1 Tax=Anthurium amnicola TaxID=1678845 RepID=A0A1D1YDC8_9ARAE